MLHFKDMTYCAAECLNLDCGRNQKHLNEGGKDHASYKRWSIGFGEGGGPVALSDYSSRCPDFKRANEVMG